MAQLNRDYDVLRKNYDQLVARRESASMAEDVDSLARMAEFRIIDPPRISPKAVFPNRLALVPLVLALALAVGHGREPRGFADPADLPRCATVAVSQASGRCSEPYRCSPRNPVIHAAAAGELRVRRWRGEPACRCTVSWITWAALAARA